jgi:hypothetical protein
MHYIKFYVNSLLFTQFWLLQKLCRSFDHCFITTHSIHSWGPLQIHFTVIICNTRHHAQSHLTSGALIHSSLSLAMRTQMAAQFHWPVFVLATLEVQNIFWALSTWFRVGDWYQNFKDCFLLKFDFFLSCHSDTYNDLPYLDSTVWPHSGKNLMPPRYERLLQLQQNRSKATMLLLHKIPAIRGCPRLLSRLMAVCCMLLPHNSYRLPQHYKRHICELSCCCKHQFLWISPFLFAFVLYEVCGYSTPLITSLATKKCSLHRPVLIFQPTANS